MNKKDLSIFKAFHDATGQILDNFAPYAKATIIFYACIALSIFFLAMANFNFFTQLNAIQSSVQINSDMAQKEVAFAQLFSLLSFHFGRFIFSLFIFLIFLAWAWLGYNLFILDMHDRESSNRLFKGAQYLIKYFCATTLFLGMVIGGFCCFIIPGIYLVIRFGFYLYFIIDKNQGVIESLSSSWQVTRQREWAILGFYIIYISVGRLGGPILLLLTFPLVVYATTCIYRQLTKSEVKNQIEEITPL